jgi:hypothetical protein
MSLFSFVMIRIDLAGCRSLGAFSAIIDYDGRIVAKRPIDGKKYPWADVRNEEEYVEKYWNENSENKEPAIGLRLVKRRNDKLIYDRRAIESIKTDYMDDELGRILGI